MACKALNDTIYDIIYDAIEFSKVIKHYKDNWDVRYINYRHHLSQPDVYYWKQLKHGDQYWVKKSTWGD
jgi:hypothetical protein